MIILLVCEKQGTIKPESKGKDREDSGGDGEREI